MYGLVGAQRTSIMIPKESEMEKNAVLALCTEVAVKGSAELPVIMVS